MSEYWINSPMISDNFKMSKDFIQEALLSEFNINMLNEKRKSQDLCKRYNIQNMKKGMVEYVRFHTKYSQWLIKECINNEFNVIKMLKTIVNMVNKANTFDKNRGIDFIIINNEMLYVIPLSFLEWKIELNSNSEISKYLLSLLKQTDGGSVERGFSIEEDKYPNGINTPNDFVKAYIEQWDRLITGKIKISDIKFTEQVG
jgi:hypothetical protein